MTVYSQIYKIDIQEGRVHVSGAPQPIKLESRTQIADPNTPSSYLKTVTEQENDEANLRTREPDEKPSDLIDYKKYIGTRVYHTAVKQCATVLDCDEVNIVLMFDGAEKENTYKLQMCLQKDWLRFEWDPDFKTIENETANQKPEGNTDNSTAEDQTYRTIPVKGDITGDYQLVPLSKKQKDEKNRTMYLAMKKNGVVVSQILCKFQIRAEQGMY